MSKVIFIGQSDSGKTTLCQKLNEKALHYKKTQAVESYGKSIDTPGEYLENRRFYNALIVTAADSAIVALVSDPTSGYRAIPPGFGSMFGKKVIGIVTKIHQADEESVEKAKQELQRAQACPIFLVDTPEGVGISELEKYLEKNMGDKS